MKRSRSNRARPSPAVLISLVALFVALGGTGYAIKRNSVGAKELRLDAVKGRHIDERKIKGRHVKPGKLKGSHVKDGTLGGNDIDESTLSAVPEAKKVAGVEPIRVHEEVAPGEPPATLLTAGGLTVRFGCGGTPAGPSANSLLLDFSGVPTTFRLVTWDGSQQSGSGERDRTRASTFGTAAKEAASLVASSAGETLTAQLQLFDADGGSDCLVSGLAFRG